VSSFMFGARLSPF